MKLVPLYREVVKLVQEEENKKNILMTKDIRKLVCIPQVAE